MTMMKKKSQEAIAILLPIANHKKNIELNIQSLVYKYIAYGYFKIGQYAQAAKYYHKIPQQEVDKSSLYNQLLAEGIELADRLHRFEEAAGKFREASAVYPQKVEPFLYLAMTHILRYNLSQGKDEVRKAETLIEALKEMEVASRLNPNSSNLLYHRTLIHLYFEDWEQAHEDINRCIEKAEENLPKYFYLRGVCHSCVKDFKKAINEFSICLSLDSQFQEAHFQKAKCHFLLGNTDKGFSSLKTFIELNPDDLSIYKWIGDLLYEGRSYRDSLKSYAEYKGEEL
jgi:tetratricopeptide (TPR) repeat protein